MNKIELDQNSDRSIALHEAKSYYYVSAERAQMVQLILLVGNAIFWPIVLIWKPELKVWSALAALCIPAIELVVLEPYQKKWKTCAAKIQELFDCDVFHLTWNDFKVSDRPREEDIAHGIAKYLERKGDATKLRDWYTFKFNDLPVSHARLICQRANAWWDSELRASNISIIKWGVCFLAAGSLVMGIVSGLTIEKFILGVIAPIAPICWWGIKEVKKQATIIADGERIVRHLESVWRALCCGLKTEPQLEFEARSLQNEIYDRRRNSAVNPQWLYWRNRDEFQSRMTQAANKFLDDYRSARNNGKV